MKKTFDEVYKGLQYLHIENTMEKNEEEVADEIRDKIRDMGWDCLDEYDDEKDWLKEHPDYSEKGCEWSQIAELEFLCENKYQREYDVDWHTFNISFFGLWGKIGTFSVELD